jgi:4-hydroxy-tetrahydrodipicolinate synthase
MEGILTALITPFKDNKIDWAAFERLVQAQIDANISGLIVSGTTGEAPTLTKEEKIDLFKCALEIGKGKTAIIAGTGNNNTADSISFSEKAAKLGVDGVLLVAPYYNKPSQEGMFQHFAAVAKAIDPVSIILYNVPSRTASDLLPETIARLAKYKNITHVKEATGLMERVTEIVMLAPRLVILSGDDKTFFHGLRFGMKGIISVASNLVPQKMIELYNLYTAGEVDKAETINHSLEPLYHYLFCESNPIPVKAAAANLGWISNELRLPLVPLSAKNIDHLKEVMTLVQKQIQ